MANQDHDRSAHARAERAKDSGPFVREGSAPNLATYRPFPESYRRSKDFLERIANAEPKARKEVERILEVLHLHRRLLSSAEAKWQPLIDRLFVLTSNITEISSELSRVQDHDGLTDADRANRREARAELGEIDRDLREQIAVGSGENDRLNSEIHWLKARIEACEKIINEARARQVTLLFEPVTTAKLANAEAVSETVAAARGRLSTLDKRRQEIESSILPPEIVKGLIRRDLDRLTNQPSIGRMIEGTDGHIYLPKIGVAQDVAVPDTFGLLVWLMRDQIESKLSAMIDEYSEGDLALSPSERKQKLDELAAERLEIERQEENAVYNGLKLRMEIVSQEGQLLLRGDADPRAILGLRAQPFGAPGSAPPSSRPPQEPVVFQQPAEGMKAGPSEFVNGKPLFAP